MAKTWRHCGAIVAGATLVIVFTLLAMVVAYDSGRVVLMRSQLQSAVDSAALAAGRVQPPTECKGAVTSAYDVQPAKWVGGGPLLERQPIVEYGYWDSVRREFLPSASGGAVRVTGRRDVDQMLLSRIGLRLGAAATHPKHIETSAVAVRNPRDIAFVVDLSGSMNDDTEPCWAPEAMVHRREGAVSTEISEQYLNDLFHDFGFGEFPGRLEYLGDSLGVAHTDSAYSEMTSDDGPLASGDIAVGYRIDIDDDEATRKQKAYRWIIDDQIVRLMPAALPDPRDAKNFQYWEKYLDYVIDAASKSSEVHVGEKGVEQGTKRPDPPSNLIGRWEARFSVPLHDHVGRAQFSRSFSDTLPMLLRVSDTGHLGNERFRRNPPSINTASRGLLPPNQDLDRITAFNNPNRSVYPDGPPTNRFKNFIGYRTYLQFIVDHGRDLRPAGLHHVPISLAHADCPTHVETIAGYTFHFPPRTQPMHAIRRALIRAMAKMRERASGPDGAARNDRVSVITFDALSGNGPRILQPLSEDYVAAMHAATKLQAAGDKGPTTAIEAGLATAWRHLQRERDGGQGREHAEKIVILITDGVPNLHAHGTTAGTTVAGSDFREESPQEAFHPADAAYALTRQMKAAGWRFICVGAGHGANHQFVDRLNGSFRQIEAAASRAPLPSAGEALEQHLLELVDAFYGTPTSRLVQ